MTQSTHLLRQVNPNWVQGDRATSQAFIPTDKDEGQLSVYNGDMITPSNSHAHYISVLRLSSAGVVTITVGECDEISLPVVADPEPYPEHTLIDFRAMKSKGERERKGKYLKVKSEARGWAYRVV